MLAHARRAFTLIELFVVILILAIVLSAAVVIAIIAVRSITIMGWRLAFLGTILPPATVMTLALLAALNTHLQGILLTIGALGFFIVAMTLAPRLKLLPPGAAKSFFSPAPPQPAPPAMP